MALESQLVLESDSPKAQMKRFKLAMPLNRGKDRSDEIAGGFTLPFRHPPPSTLFSLSLSQSQAGLLLNSRILFVC